MTEPAIREMINKYRPSALKETDILREILQQSALLGLSRLQFFEHAAFYGGTALRILHGLDRFSEDLDFSLLKPNPNFNFQPFLDGLQREMLSLGFQVEVSPKNEASPIFSAFVKGNTLQLLLTIAKEGRVPTSKHPQEKIRIKMEIDTNPPSGFDVEPKLVLNPTPFYVLTYCLPDLFAGKIHAMLCRTWKERVKGRDWYDFIWFVQKDIPVHLSHLTKRMQQSKHLPDNEELIEEKLLSLLKAKINQINWENAKNDVRAFLHDPKRIDIWSSSFFCDLLPHLKIRQ